MDNKTFIRWPESWKEITPDVQAMLNAELKRELTAGHLLFGMEVKAIARHAESDDVLFSIVSSPSVAVVHLSYSKESNSSWPQTQTFDSLDAWEEHERLKL